MSIRQPRLREPLLKKIIFAFDENKSDKRDAATVYAKHQRFRRPDILMCKFIHFQHSF